ncbi:hypothetical protein TNCV_4456171 [Trichonephila clavipes]|nr:hypothetical protein TNCV_4456171 [Trichonephila clavipes]
MSGEDGTESKTDQQAKTKLLKLGRCKPLDIPRRILAVYGESCVSKPTVTRPGVDLSRCKDHVVFRIRRIAGSRLRKVVHNFVPEKAYMRRDPL